VRPSGEPSDDRALVVARVLARWLDRGFLDPLLGLVLPGVGDAIGAVLGLYPVVLAWRRGASRTLLARMVLNLSVDALGGAVPIVGDLWDFFFRAHARNLALLEARLRDGAARARPADGLIVGGALLLLVAAVALPIVMAVAVVGWLTHRGAP
jgi:uncharacterized protein DUF4112